MTYQYNYYIKNIYKLVRKKHLTHIALLQTKLVDVMGIPAELFQILKDDAMKVLHSLRQQIQKAHQATGLENVSFHSSPKERQCQRMFKIPYNCTHFTCQQDVNNKLWNILKEMGIPDHLTCLLRNLYVGREATVRTGRGTTDWYKIGKGVHQVTGILSPCLFN